MMVLYRNYQNLHFDISKIIRIQTDSSSNISKENENYI